MARRKGAETRARIEREALRLFALKGVDGTSMRDLAAAVGVAEAALYRHFPSKEAIGREIFASQYAALAGRISAIGGEDLPFPVRLQKLVEMFCTLFDDDPDIFAFLLINQHSHLGAVAEDEAVNAVTALSAIMARAFAAGEMGVAEADLAAAMALGVVVQPAMFKLYGRLPGTMTDRMEMLARGVGSLLDAQAR